MRVQGPGYCCKFLHSLPVIARWGIPVCLEAIEDIPLQVLPPKNEPGRAQTLDNSFLFRASHPRSKFSLDYPDILEVCHLLLQSRFPMMLIRLLCAAVVAETWVDTCGKLLYERPKRAPCLMLG